MNRQHRMQLKKLINAAIFAQKAVISYKLILQTLQQI